MKRLLGILIIFSTVISQAQERIYLKDMKTRRPVSQYTIKEWSMESGLPNNAILDIEQTEEGYLWLATYNGLTRFDGTEFEVYYRGNTSELQTNHVSCLAVDSKGQLWIGTNGGGLLKYHRGIFTSYQQKTDKGSIVTAIAKGTTGGLWIGTRDGLLKFENESFQTVQDQQLKDLNVTSLFQDHKGRLWIGTTTKGLFLLDDEGITNYTTEQGLKSNFIYSVFVDSKAQVWVGTDRGVSLIGSDIKDFDDYPNSPSGYVNDFLEDHEGNIWLASMDGLYRFNVFFEKADPESTVGQHIVQSLYEDREKNIWAGTYRIGLSRLNQGKFLLLGKYEGLNNEVINVTYSDGDKTWIGTEEGFLYEQGGELIEFTIDKIAGGSRVRDIFRDSQGRMWLCTYNGLIQFDEGKIVQRYTVETGLASDNIRRIVEDHKGSLWIGTANGLSRLSNGIIDNYGAEAGLRDSYIMSLFVDNHGKLWVGTNGGGIYCFVNGQFKQVLSEQANNDIVFNFTQDEFNSMWLSTNRGVIILSDSTDFNITVQQGLISNIIFQVILEEPGLVWFASDKGVMRVTRDEISGLISGNTSFLGSARIFDQSDGLRTGEITPASITDRTEDGEIWFCTIEGVAVINSENIPTNELRANTLVTRILTNEGEFKNTEPFIVYAGNRRMEFHYTGLSLSAPEKVRYKFKLENFDLEWIDAGARRAAYYTNLAPGEYEFKVMAANNDGLWSEKPATVRFTKEAYFYQEKWFIAITGMLLIAFGAFLYYLHTIGLNRRNFRLARMVQERTRDIQHHNEEMIIHEEELKQLNLVKDKLLSVLSHDLRGPLAAVSGLLSLLKSGHLNYHELITQSKRLDTEVHNLTYLLDNLLNWSRTQMQGINLNSENVRLYQVIEANLKILRPITEQKKISIFNQVPKDCSVYTDVNFLNLVIRNLVTNALKFSHEKGEIKITSECKEDDVIVSVIDNGVGMSAEELSKLFNAEIHYSRMGTANEAGTGIGLLLCKEFIELDGGKIWAESTEGAGSSFKIQLKRGKVQLAQVNQS